MIFAENTEKREEALKHLLPEQRKDFQEIFSVMKGLPVTIRLLDPPLHEFLPQEEADVKNFAEIAGVSEANVKRRLGELHETNPMLGHRGCRLGITYPEIYAMQVRAIIEAALVEKAKPEIMIPLVAFSPELKAMKKLVTETVEQVFNEKHERVDYLVGTMIELPRAALTADELADDAEFFSFGTNDLTQTTMGLSRDDAGAFLPYYTERGLVERDPFVSIDRSGVGQLVEIAVEKGRATRSDIKLGICGEHGGDPVSIEFCEKVGLDYVSCSPYRVPIARLAAAQAKIMTEKDTTQAKKAA